MSVGAIVLAAGSSRRMGGGDKLLAALLGRPVLSWTLQAFECCEAVDHLVVVTSAANRAEIAALCTGLQKLRALVTGGRERQDSVANGLAALANVEIVAVHDGARPLITSEAIGRGVDLVRQSGAAIAGGPVADTIKVVDEDERIASTPDRTRLRAAATPQVFRRELLLRAHEAARRDEVVATDDAALVERIGAAVRVYDSGSANPKITTPEDLTVAEALLRVRLAAGDPPQSLRDSSPLGGEQDPQRGERDFFEESSTRVGIGIDTHRFEAGRPLILGGVRIPEHDGLAGHSDADALTHAIIDALLGAAGLGDIGAHFAPGDPAWAGADSIEMLTLVVAKLAEIGAAPASVDATVIAERPRLRPWVEAMRERLAQALGLPTDFVNVKATTAEGMGALGRAEGMTAHAVANITYPRI